MTIRTLHRTEGNECKCFYDGDLVDEKLFDEFAPIAFHFDNWYDKYVEGVKDFNQVKDISLCLACNLTRLMNE